MPAMPGTCLPACVLLRPTCLFLPPAYCLSLPFFFCLAEPHNYAHACSSVLPCHICPQTFLLGRPGLMPPFFPCHSVFSLPTCLLLYMAFWETGPHPHLCLYALHCICVVVFSFTVRVWRCIFVWCCCDFMPVFSPLRFDFLRIARCLKGGTYLSRHTMTLFSMPIL